MPSALKIVRHFFPKVAKVVDAKRPADIEVLPEDCKSKGALNHTTCALAVACKRAFHVEGVIISRSTAYLVKRDQARRFHLPGSVGRELAAFDRGAAFAPGKYRLSAVSPARRLGRSNRGGKKRIETGKGFEHFRHITTGIRTVLGGPEE